MSDDRVYKVLFIRTGHSARSILAEGLMAHLGSPRWRAHSAGSHPNGVVNPLALSTLHHWQIPTDGFRSKSWDEFATSSAPALDFVFTVRDTAGGKMCPLWPGQPRTAHWGVADAAAVEGSDEVRAKAFMDAAIVLKRRIELMLSLPMQSLTRLSLQHELDRIGKAGA